MEEKKELTLEEKIQNLKAQQEQAKEVFLKCAGAIELLEQMQTEEGAKTDQ